MTRIFGGEAFAFKNMPQMGVAGGADDFCPVAVRIGAAEHGTGHGIVKGRPAAPGIELVAGAVKRSAAAPAGIGAVGLMVPVAPAERGFRSAVGDDLLFVGGEGSHGASLCCQHI